MFHTVNTHMSVYIKTNCNKQNNDALKHSLLNRQNNMKTVLISFVIVIV